MTEQNEVPFNSENIRHSKALNSCQGSFLSRKLSGASTVRGQNIKCFGHNNSLQNTVSLIAHNTYCGSDQTSNVSTVSETTMLKSFCIAETMGGKVVWKGHLSDVRRTDTA
ncbi:hypothetical protein CEXT_633541 [Caerostris extrusa]|uniref:Uncharacterized protein n=1 Tax=Caerostris extrusa TaxID=172846 RepID=A0AAV4PH98_CAEEX|nr:hypothetical protein CEXT_633541 [Caerostris extrusa]